MNYGNIHNPHCDEGRLWIALQNGKTPTGKEIQDITGAGSHTPVISGVRQQLQPGEKLVCVPDGTYRSETGRLCKRYVYQLIRAAGTERRAA